MKLRWFQDDDGTYFRNRPINFEDLERESDLVFGQLQLWRRPNLRFLWDERRRIEASGVVRSDVLPAGDTVVEMAPFRVSHPARTGALGDRRFADWRVTALDRLLAEYWRSMPWWERLLRWALTQ